MLVAMNVASHGGHGVLRVRKHLLRIRAPHIVALKTGAARLTTRDIARREGAFAAQCSRLVALPAHDCWSAIEHTKRFDLRDTHERVVVYGVVDARADPGLRTPAGAKVILEEDAVLEVWPARLSNHPCVWSVTWAEGG